MTADTAQDPFARARANMVDSQVRTNDVTDLAVQDAMAAIPRERFCLPGSRHLAYAEAAVPYAPGYSLLEPRDVAKLLQAIFPLPGERALAIAAPYAAAVLARAGLAVTLVVAPDAEAICRAALEGEGVSVSAGDIAQAGADGPYGVVVCEGAVTRPPQAWKDAVGAEGRLGVIEREGPVARGMIYARGREGLLGRRTVFDATAELLPGFGPQPAFVF